MSLEVEPEDGHSPTSGLNAKTLRFRLANGSRVSSLLIFRSLNPNFSSAPFSI
jgi:hypothetical protein